MVEMSHGRVAHISQYYPRRVPHLRDGLIVAKVGSFSRQRKSQRPKPIPIYAPCVEDDGGSSIGQEFLADLRYYLPGSAHWSRPLLFAISSTIFVNN